MEQKRTVHSSVKCMDSLMQIAGKTFYGVPRVRCEISEDTVVEILDGPLAIREEGQESVEIVRVRHLREDGTTHEGWIPLSFVV